MKVDVYQNIKNNNTMDNLDKYKGKWVKYRPFSRKDSYNYLLVNEIFKVSDTNDYRINSNFHFTPIYAYNHGVFVNNLSDLTIVDESEVLEQAKKYGHKEIIEMLTKEITKEDLHNCKIWIGDNPELNRKVQEKLFELGFSWASGSIVPDFLDSKVLFIYDNVGIKYSSYLNNLEQFKKYPEKEITPEQILSIKTTESKIISKTDSILQYPNKRNKVKIFKTINLNAIYETSRKSL